MQNVSIPAALIAGLVSFLSPCVLPLVPPYLIYLTGATIEHVESNEPASASKRAIMMSALLFVLGFSTVFVALGASASLIGGLIRAWSAELSILAGIVIVVMGLHFLGLTRIGLLMREGRMPIPRPVGLWGAYIMGLAFAFGWTPCIGPILAAILSIAAAEATVTKGAGLLAVYSAGLGIPFLIAALMIEQFFYTVRAHEGPARQRRARDGRVDGDHRHRISHRRGFEREHLAARDVPGVADDRVEPQPGATLTSRCDSMWSLRGSGRLQGGHSLHRI
ncbi:cytochrome c biogenesis protein CcdA [Bradyrhizobium sp. LM2.7]